MLLLVCCEALLQQIGKILLRSISNQIALETETQPYYMVEYLVFMPFFTCVCFSVNQMLPGCKPAVDFQVPLIYTSVYLHSADPGGRK